MPPPSVRFAQESSFRGPSGASSPEAKNTGLAPTPPSPAGGEGWVGEYGLRARGFAAPRNDSVWCLLVQSPSVTRLSVGRIRDQREARKLPRRGDARRLDRRHGAGAGSIARASRRVCIGPVDRQPDSRHRWFRRQRALSPSATLPTMFGHRGLACDGQVNAEQAAQRGTPMHMSNESLVVILLVGLIAGWLAGKIVQGTGFGIIGDLIIGIIGAFIGDWLLPQVGIP